mgnify:CR=1 FL=1
MKYYPVFLDVKDRQCLVVGGGSVGLRKAVMLEKCGAQVTVVSRDFDAGRQSGNKGSMVLKQKRYDKKDLDGMFMILAATDDKELNRRICSDAAALNILTNVADAPELSDFILPAVVAQKDLMIAVSTGGASPAVAKRIRRELSEQFGPEYGQLLDLMRAVRKKLLSQGHDPDAHKEKFHALLEYGILKKIKTGDSKAVDQILEDLLGDGYQYETLLSKGSSG